MSKKSNEISCCFKLAITVFLVCSILIGSANVGRAKIVSGAYNNRTHNNSQLIYIYIFICNEKLYNKKELYSSLDLYEFIREPKTELKNSTPNSKEESR